MRTVKRLGLILGLCLALSLYLIITEAKTANREVNFRYCLDGDSAVFELNDEEIEVRLLAIDCPEINDPWGEKARDLSRDILSNAQDIELVADKDSETLDRYGRHLFWVYADGELLQLKLLENGLARVDYLFGDYEDTPLLQQAEKKARDSRLGIWRYEE